MRKNSIAGIMGITLLAAIGGSAVTAEAASATVAAPNCVVWISNPFWTEIGTVDGARVNSTIACSGGTVNVRLRTVIKYRDSTGAWRTYGSDSDRTVNFGNLSGSRTSWARMPAVSCIFSGYATVTWRLPNGVDYSRAAFSAIENLCD